MKHQRFAGKWKSAGFVPADVASPILAPKFERPRGADERQSVSTPGGIAAKVEPTRYTGAAVLGIAAMHKSNLVPVFSPEEAEATAKMRRG